MARTWQGTATTELGPGFDRRISEGPTGYRLHRAGGRVYWSVEIPGSAPLRAAVETIVGGRRHGLSFLARVGEIDGEKLIRPVLVETRFLQGAHQERLVLSPGFPTAPAASYGTAAGHALSPGFEKKCLSCHGTPLPGKVESGVRCESCHGPGQAHVEAVKRGDRRLAIVNPKRLDPAESLAVCAQCHSGFSKKADPLPGDLLVSSQAVALRNTECFKQSGGALVCTSCHDPHQDALPTGDARYASACRRCHDPGLPQHAAVCPVNQTAGCTGCHMPVQQEGSFHMADHWIRVIPGSGGASSAKPEFRSRVEPRTQFLRLIAVGDESKAREIRNQITAGASFAELAAAHSQDPSAVRGGYLGETLVKDLKPVLAGAAVRLAPGEISPVLQSGSTYLIVGRMPRDFRYRAEGLLKAADLLKANGKLSEAASKAEEALRAYPGYLRATFFLAAAEEQSGNPQRWMAYLRSAVELYPNDSTAQFNFGVALAAGGNLEQAIESYRKAIDLDPDHVSAYLNLGAALFSTGRAEEAAAALRRGLAVDPLSAPLYFSLSILERERGNAESSRRARSLAEKLDPDFVRSQTR
ncbi:MAG: tetratricopeptide repeat protein [Bryobacteraceae bacterium]